MECFLNWCTLIYLGVLFVEALPHDLAQAVPPHQLIPVLLSAGGLCPALPSLHHTISPFQGQCSCSATLRHPRPGTPSLPEILY